MPYYYITLLDYFHENVSLPPPPILAVTQVMSSHEKILGCRRAEKSYSTFMVRRGSHEEIPLVQGKAQWLHFAGAAVKRYPKSKVRETQVRW